MLSLFCSRGQAEEMLYDGFRDLAGMQREVRDVSEVRREPLFDNVPFLHLRKGDRLVKAREVEQEGKLSVMADHFHHYLQSDGQYYQLWTTEEGGKLLLSDAFHSAHACLLFDWDPSLANARELRKLLPLSHSETIPREQFERALLVIRKRFPEIKDTPETYNTRLKPDRMVTIPGQVAFEFQGISYDSFTLRFHRSTVRIGPHVCLIFGDLLLQGPPRVERWEFEGSKDYDVPNGLNMLPPEPKIAKIKKAAYDRMQQFDHLVVQSLWPDRLKQK